LSSSRSQQKTKESGLTGVQFHAANGYLLSQQHKIPRECIHFPSDFVLCMEPEYRHPRRMAAMETIRSKGNLQNLIPIAVVVVGGCEPCAAKMVTRALAQGSSWQDVDETLRILADMQKQQCVAKALGPDAVARMEKPLAAGRSTLEQARPGDSAIGDCGCGEDVNCVPVSTHK